MPEGRDISILEITGLPGAGKSTFVRKIALSLPEGWCVYSDAMVPGARLFRRRGTQIVLLGYCLLGFLSDCTRRWRQIEFALRGARDSSNSWGERLYLFVNMMLKMGRYEYVTRQKIWRGVLIDEGISHLPFNMADYRTTRNIVDPSRIFACFSNLLDVTGVLFFDVPDEEIVRRLEIRGHKRLVSGDRHQVEHFVRCNRMLGSKIKKAARKYTTFFKVIDGRKYEDGEEVIMKFIKGVSKFEE